MNRAMLGPMVLPGAATGPPPGGPRLPVLIAAVTSVAAAEAALSAGADLVEFVPSGGAGGSRTQALSDQDRGQRDELLARFPDAGVRPGPPGQVTVTGGSLRDQTLTVGTLAQLAVRPTASDTAASETAASRPAGPPADRPLADGHESDGHPAASLPVTGLPGPLVLVDADLDLQSPSICRPGPVPVPGPLRPMSGLPPLTPDLAAVVAAAALASWLGAAAVRTRHPAQVRRALDQAAVIRGLRPPARTVRGLG